MLNSSKTLQQTTSRRPLVLITCILGLFLILSFMGKSTVVLGQAGPGEPDPLEYAQDTDGCNASPTPTPTPGFCNGAPNYSTYPSGCSTGYTLLGGVCTKSYAFQSRCAGSGYDEESCTCPEGVNPSPIIIDVSGHGFNLTDAEHGVNFDIENIGSPQRIAWTTPESDNSFLVLDRNGNNLIDNGSELFGDFTPQPQPPAGVGRNGFLALNVYDKPENGGNGDGVIDSRDTIYPKLRLWQDTNHNGISEPEELHTLSSSAIAAVDLDYKPSRRVDQYGNSFRYRAKIYDIRGAKAGRWAWDVFLSINSESSSLLQFKNTALFGKVLFASP